MNGKIGTVMRIWHEERLKVMCYSSIWSRDEDMGKVNNGGSGGNCWKFRKKEA